MYPEVYTYSWKFKGHDDDFIPEYDVYFITEVSVPVDINLVKSAVAQDFTMNKLK